MSSTRESGDDDLAALVDAALTGDRSATNELLAQLRPRINRYCRSKIGSSQGTFASADDVAQEVLLAVFRALHTYKDTGSPFLAFVFGIAKNKVADHYRKYAREQHAQLDEAPDVADHRPGPETLAVREETTTAMANLLNTLTAHQRETLHLRVGAGYSAEDTAEIMHSTASAVRVTQHRALNNLRNRLRPDNGNPNAPT